MSKGMTQKEMILEYMRLFGSIDPQQAYIELGCMKLATRISELKKLGYNIESETVTYKSKWWGRKKHYKRYRLGEQQ